MAPLRYPTFEEIQAANPGMSTEQAIRVTAFARDTLDALVLHYGSVEAALADEGTPWEQVKRELDIGGDRGEAS